MIRKLMLQNVLSFGSRPVTLELENLNVLIGPNGCGKSNLLEVLYLLSRLPVSNRDASLPILDWVWKGAARDECAKIDVCVDGIPGSRAAHIQHVIEFREAAQRFSVVDELLQNPKVTDASKPAPFFFFKYDRGQALFGTSDANKRAERGVRREELDPGRSVLAQRNDPDFYPEIAHVRACYEGIRVYRDINFGPNSALRQPQRTDLPSGHLLEDGSNLGLVLNNHKTDLETRARIEELLSQFYEPATGVDVRVQGNTAQIYVTEAKWITPATRLSDGTMRWLALLAILLDPEPASLVCIDEPDVGLHPDCVTLLADLLIEASTRTQLVVATHSEVLIDALAETPESVVVCEKSDGQTTMQRLDKNELSVWLEKYSLGQLYSSGQLGGRRW